MPGHGTPAPRALIGFNSKGMWGFYVTSTLQILRTIPPKSIETAEILSINPLYPPILGDFLELGEHTPRPPAGSILHLFFSGFYNVMVESPGW